MATFVNCLIQDMDSVAWVGPGDSAEFINCLVKNIRGHAILRHPLGRVTVTNSEFYDQMDVDYANTQLMLFRKIFAIPKTISDTEIIVFANKLRRCKNRFQRETAFRKDDTGAKILRWLGRQRGVEWVSAGGLFLGPIIAALLAMQSCESVSGFHSGAPSDSQKSPSQQPQLSDQDFDVAKRQSGSRETRSRLARLNQAKLSQTKRVSTGKNRPD